MACWLRRSMTGADFLAVMRGHSSRKRRGPSREEYQPAGPGASRPGGSGPDRITLLTRARLKPPTGRTDLDPRRASPQPAGGGLRHPPEPPGRDHRAVGVREEQPGLRHPLRRRPEALRREPLRLRPPVPGPDGEAGRGVRHRAQPRHRHRAADDGQPSALHGGHRHRDLRPSPRPLCRPGPPSLPEVRAARGLPDHRADRGKTLAIARGQHGLGAGAGRPRSQGGFPQGARCAGRRGVPARPRGRASGQPRGAHRPRSPPQPPGRGPRRPPRLETGGGEAAHLRPGQGAAPGRRRGDDRGRRKRRGSTAGGWPAPVATSRSPS